MTKYKIEFLIGDNLEVEADVSYWRGFEGSYWEPPEPEDVECTAIYIAGEKLSDNVTQHIIESEDEDVFYEMILEKVHDQIQGEIDAYYEAKYDEWKERKKETWQHLNV